MARCWKSIPLLVIVATAFVAAEAAGPSESPAAEPEVVPLPQVPGKDAKLGPVNKAMELLQKLKTKVEAEGLHEAKLYNKFACFCQEQQTDKSKAVTEGKNEVAGISADIALLTTQIETETGTMQEKVGQIGAAESQIAGQKKERMAGREEWETNNKDLMGAINALDSATAALKASKASAQFVQVNTQQLTRLQPVLLLAEALGFSDSRHGKLSALLQDEPVFDVAFQAYDYGSDSVISTLGDLTTQFKQRRNTDLLTEKENERIYEESLLTLSNSIKSAESAIDTAKGAKAAAAKGRAQKFSEYTYKNAAMMDDKVFLGQLAKTCQEKAAAWDQRIKLRANELQVLGSAVQALSEVVSKTTSANTIKFAQWRISLGRARSVAANNVEMEAIEAATEKEAASEAVSFLAVASTHRSLRSAPADRNGQEREAVMSLLRDEGSKLKSAALTSLVSHIAGSPSDGMAKVRFLIQELITRLQTQAAGEATQKGFCDKETTAAKQKRDDAAKEIRETNALMAVLEARRDTSALDMVRIDTEREKLNKTKVDASATRSAELLASDATISEAEEGLSAIQAVITTLEVFYQQSAETKSGGAGSNLLAVAKDPIGAPDAGFDSEYTGNAAAASGILGMMSVIEGDFQRTVSETREAEVKAKEEYEAFDEAVQISLGKKAVAHGEALKIHGETVTELTDEDQKLKDSTGKLHSAIKELKSLHDSCVDTGMSYEERVNRRKDEIQALNDAVDILDTYSA